VSRLLPLMYDALRKLSSQRMAQERPGQAIHGLLEFGVLPGADGC
jgi:hypothetical protein